MSGLTPSPDQLGIGMRVSVHPHTNNFEHIILDAIKKTRQTLDLDGPNSGLAVSTGEVSTYVGVTAGKPAQQLADYAATLLHETSLAANFQHVVSHLLFSRGCPGEITCELIPGNIPEEQPVSLEPTGLEVVAAWSLYPLADDGAPHMEPIYAAIDQAKTAGVQVTSEHYATILRGDLADVLTAIINAWSTIGQQVPHVVTHVTISANSPSRNRAGETA